MQPQRIDWQRYALWLAWTASQRSEARAVTEVADEPRKVGACVLGQDHQVLGLGYNGFLPGFKPPADFYRDRRKRVSHIVHAETNSLVHVHRGEASLIATTQAPCATCAAQIVSRQIPLVVYGECHTDIEGIEILKFYDIEVLYLPLITIMNDWIVPATQDFLRRFNEEERQVGGSNERNSGN